MNINWYNLKILHTERASTVSEKKNHRGMYGKRKEIEPILRRFYKERKEEIHSLKSMKETIKEFRKKFSESHDDIMLDKCTDMLHRIDSFL